MEFTISSEKVTDVLVTSVDYLSDGFPNNVFRCLDIPKYKTTQWIRHYNSGTIDTETILENALNFWLERMGKKATVYNLGRCFNKFGHIAVKDSIESLAIESSGEVVIINGFKKVSNIRSENFQRILKFRVTEPDENFVGRQSTLYSLVSKLQNIVTGVLLIYGMGGQGKTQICRALIHALIVSHEKQANSVTTFETNPKVPGWMKGIKNCLLTCVANKPNPLAITWFEGQSRKSLQCSILELCQKLEIPKCESFVSDKLLKLLAEKICKNYERWIIVIDGIPMEYSELTATIDFLSNKALILASSRRCDILPAVHYLEYIDELDEKDILQLAKLLMNHEYEEYGINQIIKSVGFHPLGFRQALSYTKFRQRRSPVYDVRTCGEDLMDNCIGPLEHRLGLSNPNNNTVIEQVEWVITQIQNCSNREIAWLLIRILSFIPKVTRKYLVELADSFGYNEKEVKDGQECLSTFLLLQHDTNEIALHRVVSTVIRIKLKMSNPEFIFDILHKVASPETMTKEQIEALIGVWEKVRNIPEVVQKYKSLPNHMHWGRLKFELYKNLQELCNFARENHRLLQQFVDQFDGNAMQMNFNICSILLEEHKYKEAVKQFSTLLRTQQNILGENHPDTKKTEKSLKFAKRGFELQNEQDILSGEVKAYHNTIMMKELKNRTEDSTTKFSELQHQVIDFACESAAHNRRVVSMKHFGNENALQEQNWKGRVDKFKQKSVSASNLQTTGKKHEPNGISSKAQEIGLRPCTEIKNKEPLKTSKGKTSSRLQLHSQTRSRVIQFQEDNDISTRFQEKEVIDNNVDERRFVYLPEGRQKEPSLMTVMINQMSGGLIKAFDYCATQKKHYS